jgi:hypothetical protein
MNTAEELLGGLRKLMPEGKDPEKLVGLIVRRGFETYEVLAFDPERREFSLKDARGRETVQPLEEFFRKVVREAEPRVKNFYKPEVKK